MALGERIVEVLKQKRNSPVRVGCQVAIVYAVIHGYLNDTPVEKVPDYEQELYDLLEREYEPLLIRFEEGYYEDSDVVTLCQALDAMKR